MISSTQKLLLALLLLLGSVSSGAVDFVSVAARSAILYDAPSLQAKKVFVVNRYMPFEQVVTLAGWVKVRDRSGGLYWIEQRALSNKRFVFAVSPLADVREQPELNAAVRYQVRQQVALERLEATGTGWLKVRHPDGDTGYIRSIDVWGN